MQKQRTLDPDFERRLDQETALIMAGRQAARRPGRHGKAAMAALLVAFACAAAYLYERRAPSPAGGSAALSAFQQEFGMVQQAAVSAYGEDFSKVEARALVGANLIPARLYRRGGFRHPFGGTIRIFPLSGGGYGMAADAVPGWACSVLVYLHPGGAPDAVTVVSPEGTSTARDAPMPPREAVTACGSARGFATIEWDFE